MNSKWNRFYKFLIEAILVSISLGQCIGLVIAVPDQSIYISLGYSLVSFIVLYISYRFIRLFIQKRLLKFWQHILFAVLRTAFLSWILIGLYDLLITAKYQRLSLTLTVMAISLGLMVLLIYLSKQYRNQQILERSDEYLVLRSENKNEKLTLKSKELLFIKSSDNYCEVWCEGRTIKKALIRGSLKYLEQQICSNSIIRSHRSYIVNLAKVMDYSGNSQGLQLSFKNIEEQAYVSRKNVDKVKSILDSSDLPNRNFISIN